MKDKVFLAMTIQEVKEVFDYFNASHITSGYKDGINSVPTLIWHDNGQSITHQPMFDSDIKCTWGRYSQELNKAELVSNVRFKKICPVCGKNTAFWMERYEYAEMIADIKHPEYFDGGHWICDIRNEGCGSSSGWKESQDEIWERING